MSNKIAELNKIREDIFALYPKATKITLTFEGEKIKVTPDEKYEVPIGGLEGQE
jgi:hypothetical protein